MRPSPPRTAGYGVACYWKRYAAVYGGISCWWSRPKELWCSCSRLWSWPYEKEVSKNSRWQYLERVLERAGYGCLRQGHMRRGRCEVEATAIEVGPVVLLVVLVEVGALEHVSQVVHALYSPSLTVGLLAMLHHAVHMCA